MVSPKKPRQVKINFPSKSSPGCERLRGHNSFEPSTSDADFSTTARITSIVYLTPEGLPRSECNRHLRVGSCVRRPRAELRDACVRVPLLRGPTIPQAAKRCQEPLKRFLTPFHGLDVPGGTLDNSPAFSTLGMTSANRTSDSPVGTIEATSAVPTGLGNASCRCHAQR